MLQHVASTQVSEDAWEDEDEGKPRKKVLVRIYRSKITGKPRRRISTDGGKTWRWVGCVAGPQAKSKKAASMCPSYESEETCTSGQGQDYGSFWSPPLRGGAGLSCDKSGSETYASTP